MEIGAIILAAGMSTRMGACKPLLTIGPRTLLGHAITLFVAAGIEDIVVVVGHDSARVIEEAGRYPCRPIHNGNSIEGMFSSVKAGVEALAAVDRAFFLLPVDIPLVCPTTLRRLAEVFDREPSALVVYPKFDGRRGHPPLVSADLVAAILGHDGQGGMRALLRRYNRQCRDIAVNDPNILLDADTQDDLALLEERYLQALPSTISKPESAGRRLPG